MKTQSGFTLVEMLVALAITVVLTTGSLFTLRALRRTDESFNTLSDVHISLVRIEQAIRDDLSRSEKTISLEPHREIRGIVAAIVDAQVSPPVTVEREKRVSESLDGIFNRRCDIFTAIDDINTRPLIARSVFLGTPYLRDRPSNESRGLPLPNARTPFSDPVVEGVNQPFGPVYDFFGGILNNGFRDVLYFQTSEETANGTQRVAVAFRLVETSNRFNGDRGTDGLENEFEPGFHPVYRRDPSRDDHPNPTRNIVEGDGRLTGFEGQTGGFLDRQPSRYELQRVIYSMDSGPQFALPRPRVLASPISQDVVGFNVLYYDRIEKRYREPERLVKRFGYPEDFGAPVVAIGRKRFQMVEHTRQSEDLVVGDSIFLYQLNLDWEPTDDPTLIYSVPPQIYTIQSVGAPANGGGVRFSVAESIFANLSDPAASVGGMGSVGYLDPEGILRSRAVYDGFHNLKPNDEIYLEQRRLPLAHEVQLADAFDPTLPTRPYVYSIQPGMYRIQAHRGEGIKIDLKGQIPLSGVPVLFRAAYFPPAIKLELSIGRHNPIQNTVIMRNVPIVIRMPQE